MSEERYLTPDELTMFKLDEKENQLLAMRLELSKMQLKNSSLEIALLNSQFSLKKKVEQELRNDLKNSENKIKSFNTKVKNKSDKLKKKYKLKDRWGFDPDSGKIIID